MICFRAQPSVENLNNAAACRYAYGLGVLRHSNSGEIILQTETLAPSNIMNALTPAQTDHDLRRRAGTQNPREAHPTAYRVRSRPPDSPFSSSYSNPQTLHTYFIFLSPYLVIIDYSFSWLGNRFCRVAGWAMMPAAIRFDEYADHRSSCSISLCSAARQSGQIPLIDRPMANAAVARLCRDMLVKLMAVFGGCVTHRPQRTQSR